MVEAAGTTTQAPVVDNAYKAPSEFLDAAYLANRSFLFEKCGVNKGGFITGSIRSAGGEFNRAENALHQAAKMGYQFSAGEMTQPAYEAAMSKLATNNSAYLTGKDEVTQGVKAIGNRTLLGFGGFVAGMAFGSKAFGKGPARILGFATTGVVTGLLGMLGGFFFGHKIGDGIGSVADWAGESMGKDTWLGRNAKGLGDLVRRFTGAGHKVDVRDNAMEMLKKAAQLGADKATENGVATRTLPKNGKVTGVAATQKTDAEKAPEAAVPAHTTEATTEPNFKEQEKSVVLVNDTDRQLTFDSKIEVLQTPKEKLEFQLSALECFKANYGPDAEGVKAIDARIAELKAQATLEGVILANPLPAMKSEDFTKLSMADADVIMGADPKLQETIMKQATDAARQRLLKVRDAKAKKLAAVVNFSATKPVVPNAIETAPTVAANESQKFDPAIVEAIKKEFTAFEAFPADLQTKLVELQTQLVERDAAKDSILAQKVKEEMSNAVIDGMNPKNQATALGTTLNKSGMRDIKLDAQGDAMLAMISGLDNSKKEQTLTVH
jgi:hypothetical protein